MQGRIIHRLQGRLIHRLQGRLIQRLQAMFRMSMVIRKGFFYLLMILEIICNKNFIVSIINQLE